MKTQKVISDGHLFITKTEVDGGIVVNSYDKSHNMLGSCFVPDIRTQISALIISGELSGQFYTPAGFFVEGRAKSWSTKDADLLADHSVVLADALIKRLKMDKIV